MRKLTRDELPSVPKIYVDEHRKLLTISCTEDSLEARNGAAHLRFYDSMITWVWLFLRPAQVMEGFDIITNKEYTPDKQ